MRIRHFQTSEEDLFGPLCFNLLISLGLATTLVRSTVQKAQIKKSCLFVCNSADHIASPKAKIVPRVLWELRTQEKFI